jgi:glycine hydroxymethyltransferase
MESDFFRKSLNQEDPEIGEAIQKELQRQQTHVELIASENIVSRAVLEAQGSILTNKYAEGYSGRRYYGGCSFVDEAENLAIDRAKQLFNCAYANVQPHSGTQANLAVYLALLTPGEGILGMSLNAGGHLTHGSSVSLSGKWFKSVGYGVTQETGLVDYEEIECLALTHKPKLIIAGGSAYPRILDFKKFREIADKVGAYLMVDMAHFSGLVAGGIYPSPLPHAHVVTSTTHKTLRGPRGGLILSNDIELGKKVNSAVFPGSQGGPLMHVIAAKAVAFKEALQPSYKDYVKQVVINTQEIGKTLESRGFSLVSGGTDTHLILVDLRPKNITGIDAEITLDHAGITCNKNSIPFDPQPAKITSGIRLGAAAITTRGFTEEDCRHLAHLIADTLEDFVKNKGDNLATEQRVKKEILALCKKHPIY